MPRVPSMTEAQASAQSGVFPVALLDITTSGGTTYYWAEIEGSYPKADGSGNTSYSAYVKSAGNIRRSRDFRTDAGDIVVQNLSGGAIARDVLTAMNAAEFEGALCILRLFNLLQQTVEDRFDGYLTDQDGDEEQIGFRLLQLLDAQQFDVADDVYAETCSLRFKEDRCASASGATVCNKTFNPGSAVAPDCSAQEHFTGVPNPSPLKVIYGA